MSRRSQKPRGSVVDLQVECERTCRSYQDKCSETNNLSLEEVAQKCREDPELRHKAADCANGRYYCSVWKRPGGKTCADILNMQPESKEHGHLYAYRRAQERSDRCLEVASHELLEKRRLRLEREPRVATARPLPVQKGPNPIPVSFPHQLLDEEDSEEASEEAPEPASSSRSELAQTFRKQRSKRDLKPTPDPKKPSPEDPENRPCGRGVLLWALDLVQLLCQRIGGSDLQPPDFLDLLDAWTSYPNRGEQLQALIGYLAALRTQYRGFLAASEPEFRDGAMENLDTLISNLFWSVKAGRAHFLPGAYKQVLQDSEGRQIYDPASLYALQSTLRGNFHRSRPKELTYEESRAQWAKWDPTKVLEKRSQSDVVVLLFLAEERAVAFFAFFFNRRACGVRVPLQGHLLKIMLDVFDSKVSKILRVFLSQLVFKPSFFDRVTEEGGLLSLCTTYLRRSDECLAVGVFHKQEFLPERGAAQARSAHVLALPFCTGSPIHADLDGLQHGWDLSEFQSLWKLEGESLHDRTTASRNSSLSSLEAFCPGEETWAKIWEVSATGLYGLLRLLPWEWKVQEGELGLFCQGTRSLPWVGEALVGYPGMGIFKVHLSLPVLVLTYRRACQDQTDSCQDKEERYVLLAMMIGHQRPMYVPLMGEVTTSPQMHETLLGISKPQTLTPFTIDLTSGKHHGFSKLEFPEQDLDVLLQWFQARLSEEEELFMTQESRDMS